MAATQATRCPTCGLAPRSGFPLWTKLSLAVISASLAFLAIAVFFLVFFVAQVPDRAARGTNEPAAEAPPAERR